MRIPGSTAFTMYSSLSKAPISHISDISSWHLPCDQVLQLCTHLPSAPIVSSVWTPVCLMILHSYVQCLQIRRISNVFPKNETVFQIRKYNTPHFLAGTLCAAPIAGLIITAGCCCRRQGKVTSPVLDR